MRFEEISRYISRRKVLVFYLDGEVMVFLCERRESLLSLISFSRSEEKLSAKDLVLSAK